MEIPVNIKSVCKQLQASERHTKIIALDNLKLLCSEEESDNGAANLSTQELRQLFDEVYLHLLKCYSDHYESVRERAVQTVTYFLKRLPPIDFHAVNVLSTLAERMGQSATLEDSEEIRLLYIDQLDLLIQQYTRPEKVNAFQTLCDNIVRILCRSVRDEFPGVLKQVCASIVALSAVKSPLFQIYAEQLMRSLGGIQNHKHSQVRIAGIKAICHLALHMKSSDDLLPRTMMEMSPLLMDPMPLVRRECGEMGVLLAMKLHDRYSYFDRLVPFILGALKDSSPDVVNYIRPLWIKCGEQFYNENVMELGQQELTDNDLPEYYPEDVDRPTIGCRAIVQCSLRFVHLIVYEVGNWQMEVRLHAVKLIYQFVLHAEAAIATKFMVIYPALAHLCRDLNPVLTTEAAKVAKLMGIFVPFDIWFIPSFDRLRQHPNLGCIKCFYFMLTTAKVTAINDILNVTKLLVQPRFSQVHIEFGYQLYVLRFLETLLAKTVATTPPKDRLDKHQSIVEHIEANIYIATVKIIALAKETITEIEIIKDLQVKADELLENLANRQNITIGNLHERYFSQALAYIVGLNAVYDALAEPILLLSGLLKVAQFRAPYMLDLQNKIISVWDCRCDEARCKVFNTISTVMLTWHQNMVPNVDLEKSTKLLNDFGKLVIEPHLQTNVGIQAQTMRLFAASTMCAMTDGAPEESRQILPLLFAQYMPSLLENEEYLIRYYAIKIVSKFGPLSVEKLRPIAYSAIQRLSDCSSDIREQAAAIPIKLEPIFQPKQEDDERDYDRTAWETIIEHACNMLFKHYDGIDNRLQRASKATIIELNCKYPQIVKEAFSRALVEQYCSVALAELYEELGIQSD